jgi:hypothetical protein
MIKNIFQNIENNIENDFYNVEDSYTVCQNKIPSTLGLLLNVKLLYII